MMMPALPGAHLVLVHAHFAFASFEARFNARARLDHPPQFPKRRFLKCHLGPIGRREIIVVAGVLIGGIPRGVGFQRPVVRQGPPGDHQPLVGARPFAFKPRLYPAFDYLNGHRAFLTVSHRQGRPRRRIEALAPLRHRLPRGFRAPSTPVIRGQRRLEVAQRGRAGDPQHIPLATLAQFVPKPGVATQFIIAGDPAVGYQLPPRVEHLHALFLSCVIAHLRWHMALLASSLVPYPFLGQGQAKVEQGMLMVTDVAHEDADLAVVDLSPVATPLALDPHRVYAAFGATAGIESDDAIEDAQSIDHLTNQHLDQWSMIPWCSADEGLDDLALDLD